VQNLLKQMEYKTLQAKKDGQEKVFLLLNLVTAVD
jgi:hypothetical protein